MRAGYLRKNGVPYSENATVTEYFDVSPLPNGGQLMVGTKVKGDTVPRPLAVALDPTEMLREGYTVVGYFNGAFTSPCYILQK